MDQDKNLYAPTEVRVDDVLTGEPELAGLGERLGAAIIDGLIIGGVLALIMFLALPSIFLVQNRGIAGSIGIALLTGVIYFALYAAINSMLLPKGQTIGKKLVNIKIVRSDGSPTTVSRILFLRLAPLQIVGALIPIFGGLVGLVDILLIFRQSRQCLHDNIADTIVVKA